MLIKTRDFGEVEVGEEQIVTFKGAMLGFEEYKKYIILFDNNIGGNIAWLQSVDEPSVCFMLASPSLLKKEYKPLISEESIAKIGANYEIWLVAVITPDVKSSTVNLKSPVLINTLEHTALQEVSESDLPVRYGLFGKETE